MLSTHTADEWRNLVAGIVAVARSGRKFAGVVSHKVKSLPLPDDDWIAKLEALDSLLLTKWDMPLKDKLTDMLEFFIWVRNVWYGHDVEQVVKGRFKHRRDIGLFFQDRTPWLFDNLIKIAQFCDARCHEVVQQLCSPFWKKGDSLDEKRKATRPS